MTTDEARLKEYTELIPDYILKLPWVEELLNVVSMLQGKIDRYQIEEIIGRLKDANKEKLIWAASGIIIQFKIKLLKEIAALKTSEWEKGLADKRIKALETQLKGVRPGMVFELTRINSSNLYVAADNMGEAASKEHDAVSIVQLGKLSYANKESE